MKTYMCSECGEAFGENFLEEHMKIEHGINMSEAEDREIQRKEAEEILMADDKSLRIKAGRYDKIMEILFASMTHGEDGQGMKYTIHPEVVINKIISEIIVNLEMDEIEYSKSLLNDVDFEGNPW